MTVNGEERFDRGARVRSTTRREAHDAADLRHELDRERRLEMLVEVALTAGALLLVIVIIALGGSK